MKRNWHGEKQIEACRKFSTKSPLAVFAGKPQLQSNLVSFRFTQHTIVSGHGKYESGQRMNGMKTGGRGLQEKMTSHNCPPHYMSKTDPNSEGHW